MKHYLVLLLMIFSITTYAAGTYVGTDSTSINMRSKTVAIQCKQPEINIAAKHTVTATPGSPLQCAQGEVAIGYTRTPLTTRGTSSQWLTDVQESSSTLYKKSYYPSLEYGSGQPVMSLICAPVKIEFQDGACTQ
jgi:hypothetical protein